jgi:hypothetical protein
MYTKNYAYELCRIASLLCSSSEDTHRYSPKRKEEEPVTKIWTLPPLEEKR